MSTRPPCPGVNPIAARSMSAAAVIVASQVVLILLVPLIHFVYPVFYVRLVAEDNWGEFATFAAFMLAGLLFAWLFLSSKNKLKDIWYALLAIVTLFVAMEEISWGQRIVDVSTPSFLRNMNYQGEINFHNIEALKLSGHSAYLLLSWSFVVYGLVLPLLVRYSSRVAVLVHKFNLPLPSLALSPLFLATAYFLVYSPLIKGTEIGELFFGFSFACLAVEQTLGKRRYVGSTSRDQWLGGGFVSATIIASLLCGVLLTSIFSGAAGYSDRNFARELNRFAIELYPARQYYPPAFTIFSYLERHPEFSIGNVYFNKGQLLEKTGNEQQARALFHRALDEETASIARDGNNPESLRSLSFIHAALGNTAGRDDHLKKSFDSYDVRMIEKAVHKQGPGTDEAQYSVWQERTYHKRWLYYRHMFQAESYVKLAEFDRAIEQYLAASRFAITPTFQRNLGYRIAYSVSNLCGVSIHRVSWEQIDNLKGDRSICDQIDLSPFNPVSSGR